MLAKIIHIVNLILIYCFEIIYWPLSRLGHFWSLIVISLLAGPLFLWIFGKISNQQAIKKVRDQINASLIAIRLFNNNFGVFIQILLRILRHTLIHMKYSAIPLIILIIPVGLILIQLDLRYSVRPLKVGEQTIIKVKVNDKSYLTNSQTISLATNEGIVIETPGLRIPGKNEIAWRIRTLSNGKHRLEIHIGNDKIEKDVPVGPQRRPASQIRVGNLLQMVLNPGEAPIDRTGGIDSIEVLLPPLKIDYFGWQINWMVQFFIFTLIFGFLSKGFIKVHI